MKLFDEINKRRYHIQDFKGETMIVELSKKDGQWGYDTDGGWYPQCELEPIIKEIGRLNKAEGKQRGTR